MRWVEFQNKADFLGDPIPKMICPGCSEGRMGGYSSCVPSDGMK